MNRSSERLITTTHPRIKKREHMSGTMADYVLVPALALRGTWPLMDMLSDDSIRSALEAYAQMKRRGHV